MKKKTVGDYELGEKLVSGFKSNVQHAMHYIPC